MRVEHLREWLREHRAQRAVAEAEDEGVMSEVGWRERLTEARRDVGEEERTQTKWKMVVELIQTAFHE